MSSSTASLVAEAAGDTWIPWPCRARHIPTVRWSCQPMPGAMGTPVARSQTTVDDRWLATPTASTGPPASSARRETSRTAAAISAASNSTKPWAGVVGRTCAVLHVGDRGVGRDDGGPHAAGADVDDEEAHSAGGRGGGSSAGVVDGCCLRARVAIRAPKMPAVAAMKPLKTRAVTSGARPSMARTTTTTTTMTT